MWLHPAAQTTATAATLDSGQRRRLFEFRGLRQYWQPDLPVVPSFPVGEADYGASSDTCISAPGGGLWIRRRFGHATRIVEASPPPLQSGEEPEATDAGQRVCRAVGSHCHSQVGIRRRRWGAALDDTETVPGGASSSDRARDSGSTRLRQLHSPSCAQTVPCSAIGDEDEDEDGDGGGDGLCGNRSQEASARGSQPPPHTRRHSSTAAASSSVIPKWTQSSGKGKGQSKRKGQRERSVQGQGSRSREGSLEEGQAASPAETCADAIDGQYTVDVSLCQTDFEGTPEFSYDHPVPLSCGAADDGGWTAVWNRGLAVATDQQLDDWLHAAVDLAEEIEALIHLRQCSAEERTADLRCWDDVSDTIEHMKTEIQDAQISSQRLCSICRFGVGRGYIYVCTCGFNILHHNFHDFAPVAMSVGGQRIAGSEWRHPDFGLSMPFDAHRKRLKERASEVARGHAAWADIFGASSDEDCNAVTLPFSFGAATEVYIAEPRVNERTARRSRRGGQKHRK